MVCMENAAVAIATAWNLVAKKNESAEIVQIATILRVMGTLVTCSEEYSEDIKTILGGNKCLPALFNILLNDPKNAASAEKVLMGLITFSFGDRKGTYDGRVCGGNEETAWLPASIIVNAINENFENPDKVTLWLGQYVYWHVHAKHGKCNGDWQSSGCEFVPKLLI